MNKKQARFVDLLYHQINGKQYLQALKSIQKNASLCQNLTIVQCLKCVVMIQLSSVCGNQIRTETSNSSSSSFSNSIRKEKDDEEWLLDESSWYLGQGMTLLDSIVSNTIRANPSSNIDTKLNFTGALDEDCINALCLAAKIGNRMDVLYDIVVHEKYKDMIPNATLLEYLYLILCQGTALNNPTTMYDVQGHRSSNNKKIAIIPQSEVLERIQVLHMKQREYGIVAWCLLQRTKLLYEEECVYSDSNANTINNNKKKMLPMLAQRMLEKITVSSWDLELCKLYLVAVQYQDDNLLQHILHILTFESSSSLDKSNNASISNMMKEVLQTLQRVATRTEILELYIEYYQNNNKNSYKNNVILEEGTFLLVQQHHVRRVYEELISLHPDNWMYYQGLLDTIAKSTAISNNTPSNTSDNNDETNYEIQWKEYYDYESRHGTRSAHLFLIAISQLQFKVQINDNIADTSSPSFRLFLKYISFYAWKYRASKNTWCDIRPYLTPYRHTSDSTHIASILHALSHHYDHDDNLIENQQDTSSCLWVFTYVQALHYLTEDAATGLEFLLTKSNTQYNDDDVILQDLRLQLESLSDQTASSHTYNTDDVLLRYLLHPSYEHYKQLNLKHIQNVSVSYIGILPCLRSGNITAVLEICQQVFQFHHSKNTSTQSHIQRALQQGKYDTAYDMMQFVYKCRKCVVLAYCKALMLNYGALLMVTSSSDDNKEKQRQRSAILSEQWNGWNVSSAASLLHEIGNNNDKNYYYSDNRDQNIVTHANYPIVSSSSFSWNSNLNKNDEKQKHYYWQDYDDMVSYIRRTVTVQWELIQYFTNNDAHTTNTALSSSTTASQRNESCPMYERVAFQYIPNIMMERVSNEEKQHILREIHEWCGL